MNSRSLSRRCFLRAAGVAVALPVLPSLLPRGVRAEVTAETKRFVALFWPNGTTLRQDWQFSGGGSSYTMGSAHASLEPLKSKLSMFTGLDTNSGGTPAHSRGTAAFLTAATINDPDTASVDLSIDQAIADAIEPPTPIRSLHLGPNPYSGGNPSDTGWSSGYNTFLSWQSPDAPNAALENPQTAFDQIYVPPDADAALAEQRVALQQSVLDHTLEQIDTIEPRLGAEDRQRLDRYLTAVRQVEQGLQTPNPAAGCGDATDRPDEGLSFADHTQSMLDVLALALSCDATRVATYSMDYGFGNKSFSFLGKGNYRHHNIGHSGNGPELIAAHTAIVRWYQDQIAYFLTQLDAIEEEGGTVLDKSVVYVGSDVADAWSHAKNDLPMMVAGGGGGALNPGRLIDATGAGYASVLLALAHAMDAPLGSFGGESSPFGGL